MYYLSVFRYRKLNMVWLFIVFSAIIQANTTKNWKFILFGLITSTALFYDMLICHGSGLLKIEFCNSWGLILKIEFLILIDILHSNTKHKTTAKMAAACTRVLRALVSECIALCFCVQDDHCVGTFLLRPSRHHCDVCNKLPYPHSCGHLSLVRNSKVVMIISLVFWTSCFFHLISVL